MSSKACATEDRQNGLHEFFFNLASKETVKKKKKVIKETPK